LLPFRSGSLQAGKIPAREANMNKTQTTFYKAYIGDTKVIGASQGQSALKFKRSVAPLMALVGLISGTPDGDLDDLKEYLARQQTTARPNKCQACRQTISAAGRGHSDDCWIRLSALEVLDGAPDRKTLIDIERQETTARRKAKAQAAKSVRFSMTKSNPTPDLQTAPAPVKTPTKTARKGLKNPCQI